MSSTDAKLKPRVVGKVRINRLLITTAQEWAARL